MSRSCSRRLSRNLSVRFSPAEVDELISHAAARGLGPSTFIRQQMLRRLGRASPPARQRRSDLAKAVASCAGQVARLGHLLNQVAKAANRGVAVDAVALHRLRAQVETLTRVLLDLGEVGR
jgi:hypothetical protein